MFFVFSLAWDKDMSHACDQNKNIFLYFFTKHKTYHLSYSNYVGFIVEKNAFSVSKFCTSFLPKTPGSAPASDRLVPYL